MIGENTGMMPIAEAHYSCDAQALMVQSEKRTGN